MKYRRASGEDGFTVLELTISMAILAIVTTALAPMFSGSLVHVAWAKQRQAAATLVDQTLEQVRALPFSTVANGLDTADVKGSGDSNIAIAGSTFTYTNGETVPHGTLGYTQVPLVPHSTSTVENGTTYTIKVYPTNYQGSTSILRVSVLVSWAASYQAHLPALVKGQTLLFSDSSGCLSKTTHPFAAPCQPFLTPRRRPAPARSS
jgi:prepilin-type N-terminal cleavage/methylation domain-containing protein